MSTALNARGMVEPPAYTERADALRGLMRDFASPVTVVTVRGEGEPGGGNGGGPGGGEARGMTVSSLTSVSMNPPLISFNVDRSSQMHGVIRGAERFAVHLPGPDDADLCDVFAEPNRTGEEQLAQVDHRLDPHGLPILDGGWAVLWCAVHDRVRAGDHSLIIGRVLDINRRRPGTPLLYHHRTYRRLGPPVDDEDPSP